MPEGIVTELLIGVALVAILGAVFFLAPTRRDRTRRPKDADPVIAPPKPEETVTAEGPTTAPTAEADSRRAPPTAPEFPQDAVAERPSLRERLSRSRKFLSDRLADAFHGAPDDDTWDDVEAALIQADIGVDLATKIVDDLRDKARQRRVASADDVRALLADELVELFDTDLDRGLAFAPTGTTVWLVVGVNGTGKTTTIGKLAKDLKERNRTVALAAADTFRAAADEQLGVWGERAGAEVVRHQHGADPGAVAYDAYKFARARNLDVLLVDTAGRLHTKTPLMDELAKVRRVIEKEGQVHEALLVIDATAGQNGLTQAREFAEASGVTGIVLTKLDGTAKGGIALAIEQTLRIPIKLIGVGEAIDDIEPFDPKTFVDALLS
ncbi:MAG: signal recognition particle-docking protein FtsY [Actinobacteria bacterium]|nr:signal recognition particle-docking protein FtsY [Actinomycetota bacterium]